MSGMTQQDLDVLQFYAAQGNRELYWNYLAQKEGADGYGLLALGVVRNDSMPGAVANHFADSRARSEGRVLTERDWERFGEDLVRRDLSLRSAHFGDGRPDLALNLPVKDVQRAHDGAFREARIDPNAWTPRQLLDAARRQGGEAEAEKVWANMLDGRGLGIARMGITTGDVIYTYNDGALPATRYLGAMGLATAVAAGDRDRTDPNIVGARDFYYMYDQRSGEWSSVSNAGPAGPMIREVTDARQLRELNGARAVRLESQTQRDDWHPQDPNRNRPIVRSPFTLAEASQSQDQDTRLAAHQGSPAEANIQRLDNRPLYQQAFVAVSRRDAELGREPDASTRCLALAGAGIAARYGYDRIDDIVFNTATDKLAAGERFFVVQGGRDDRAHLRESMQTRDALAMTPEQQQRAFAQLDTNWTQARELVQAQEQAQQRQPSAPQLA
jgi:hypothetical protein